MAGSVRVIIEQDTGGGRVGVQSPQATLELAQKIAKMPGLDFQGHYDLWKQYSRAKAIH